MKILYITTVGCTMSFFKDLIKHLTDQGHTVDLACNEQDYKIDPFFHELKLKTFPLSCSRSPFSAGNVKAVKEIKEIVKNGGYDIVHCHTPIAAACTRLACKGFRKKGLRVIYTAHGFHFFKGAPKQNWAIFYPLEKLCARYTDTLITINREDYELSKNKFKTTKSLYVPGVGINTERFADAACDREAKRKELAVPEDAFLLLSVGELNENKNHRTVIKAIAELESKNVHYAVAGKGGERENLLSLASELGISDRIHLLGQRNDIRELLKTADAFLHPSLREGLPVSVTEALAAGLPCIVSNIRGCSDLVDENGGFLCEPLDKNAFAEKINRLMFDSALCASMGEYNRQKATQFDIKAIIDSMCKIYGTQERVETVAK